MGENAGIPDAFPQNHVSEIQLIIAYKRSKCKRFPNFLHDFPLFFTIRNGRTLLIRILPRLITVRPEWI